MHFKHEYLAPLARLINESFDIDFDAITAFDPTLVSPFETNWQKMITDVEALILPESVTLLMTGQKDIYQAAMVAQSPLTAVLAIRITMAIKNGTIKQSLTSFMLHKLNQSINQLNTKKYTVAFTNTMAQVNTKANTNALLNIGFTQDMIDLLNSNNVNVTTAQKKYNQLKISRKNLTPANLLLLKQLYDTTAIVCVSGVGTFSMPLNTDKVDQYTISKVLPSVRPTPPKEPRDRHIAATKSICLKTNPIGKDTLQMTLTTKVTEPIYYCLCETKTGVCTAGGILQYNVTTNILQKDITGTGTHIVISNSNLVNITVSVFTMIG